LLRHRITDPDAAGVPIYIEATSPIATLTNTDFRAASTCSGRDHKTPG
jgi:hypothetical protein